MHKNSFVLTFVMAVGFWFVMSGIFSIGFAVFALFSIAVSMFLLRRFGFLIDFSISPFCIRYVLRVMNDIITSSMYITRQIWQENFTISPGIAVVNFSKIEKNTAKATMHANAITMTPGTIVIGIDSNQMLVHFADKTQISNEPSVNISKILD